MLSPMLGYYRLRLAATEAHHRDVLVIEDDEFLRPALARILYSIDPNLNLRWITNYEQGRQAIHQQKPDLIISDCKEHRRNCST